MNRLSIDLYTFTLSLSLLTSCLNTKKYEPSEAPLDPDPPTVGGQPKGGRDTMSPSESGTQARDQPLGGESLGGIVAGETGGAGQAGQAAEAGQENTGGEANAGSADGGYALKGGEEPLPPEICSVEFIVHVPSDTPLNDEIYLVGDLYIPAWDPRAPEGLMNRSGSRATLTLDLPRLANIAYKFTRGSFEVEEVSETCEPISDRVSFINCTSSEGLQVIDSEVIKWRGPGGECP